MEKLNVCLVNDSFPPEIDGVANAVTNYAVIINKMGHSATVVTPSNPQADDSAFSFPVCRYPSLDTTRLVGYRAGLPFSPEIQRQLDGRSFDIIHSHCPISSTLLARMLRERIDVPLVMTYHTKFDIDIAKAINSKLMQEEAKKLLVENISACDEVWTVSRGAGENLRSLGYQGDYIIMPNGVDLPRGRVEDELIKQVTQGLDLPEALPVFLFVGRMMWYKGIRIILDALKALAGTGRDFRMVFVGGGQDLEEIKDYCASLELEGRVIFVPPIHDRSLIRAWYCRADLFLFPSSFDTNGLVVREAAACGLASVLIRGSCAAEDVTDGETGFLIEENSESMAEKLETLCRCPNTVKRVGEQAQQGLYISWDEAVERACRRYEKVIENYKAGRRPRHDSLTDDFIRAMSNSMEAWDEYRDRQREHFMELKQEYRELKEEYRELKEEMNSSRQKLKESIAQYFERFM